MVEQLSKRSVMQVIWVHQHSPQCIRLWMITSSPLLLANTQRQHRPYQCPLVNREFHRIRSTRNDIMKALTFFFFQLETFPCVTKRQIEKLFYSKGARSIAWVTFFYQARRLNSCYSVLHACKTFFVQHKAACRRGLCVNIVENNQLGLVMCQNCCHNSYWF